MLKASYKDITREVFDTVSDRVWSDEKVNRKVMVYYDGSNLRGDMTIEGSGGNILEFKRALQIFNEEYCGK